MKENSKHTYFQIVKQKKTVCSLLSAVIVAFLLSIALHHLYHIQPNCSYSRYVHEADLDGYPEVEETDLYRYGVDYCDYVRDGAGEIYDYFGLIRISGWEVAEQGEHWGSNMNGVLLRSNCCAYRIDTEMQKKTDIPYLDQSNPEDRALNVAFFTYIPQDSLSTGSYRIGLLVREGRQDKVLWTESMLEVQ